VHEIDLNTIMPKELTSLALSETDRFDEAIELIRKGKLQVLPINTHTLMLSEGPQALAMVHMGNQT